jgi:hypothetical protein
VLYTGGGSQYPSSVLEGLKSEELRAVNAPVLDTTFTVREAHAVWLIPSGSRAYYLPEAAVHVLASDIEIIALAPAQGWVELPSEYSHADFGGTSRLIPTESPFFAYETYRAIFRQAKLSLMVVDRYANAGSLVPLLTANPVNTRLLVDRKNVDLATRAKLFADQFQIKFEIRCLDPYPIHDRFLIVDERHVWHLGASLNTLRKASMVRLLEGDDATGARKTIDEAWLKASG